MKKHKIGKHGAVGYLTRRRNDIIKICCECEKEIKDEKLHAIKYNS